MKQNQQTYALLDPKKLLKHPDSPHSGDIEAIAASIRANGFGKPVVVWAADGRTVLAGWSKSRAALMQGIPRVPCLVVSCDKKTALRIMLADNKTAELGGYDETQLAELLGEATAAAPPPDAGKVKGDYNYSLTRTGYSAEEVEKVIAAAVNAVQPERHNVLDDVDDAQAAADLKEELEVKGYRVMLTAVK